MKGRDLAVLRLDGGICSQIGYVSFGLSLAKATGQMVKYDLSWYRDNGKDNDGLFVRNWDMDKAFPRLPAEAATESEIAFCRSSRVWNGGKRDFRGPIYIQRDPGDRWGHFLANAPDLRACFKPVLDEANAALEGEILSDPSCAVHVRRGDLAKYDTCYGRPTSPEYFVAAVKIMRGLEPRTRFFLFSDEPDWVKNCLLPLLPRDSDYRLCPANGSDRGYIDLYLMSKCDRIVSSQGSMGVAAAILSEKSPLLMISRRRSWVETGLPNVLYLNDDFGVETPVDPRGNLRSPAPSESLLKKIFKKFCHRSVIDAYTLSDGGEGSGNKRP